MLLIVGLGLMVFLAVCLVLTAAVSFKASAIIAAKARAEQAKAAKPDN